MTTNSVIEYILMLTGWLLNNSLWNVITSTGLWIFPVSLKMAGTWLKVREEGFDEGNKGFLLLPRLENLVYTSYVIVLFFCIPTIPADLYPLQGEGRDVICRGEKAVSVQDSNYAPLISQFSDGHMPSVPLWWYAVHRISRGITQAMISTIPCGGKIRHLRFLVQHSQLKDKILIDELQAFSNACYARAYYHLKSENPKLSDDDLDSVSWIGSDYFMNTPGYYDYYTAKTPLKAWPYDPSRDTGYADNGSGGYPTCKQWWLDSNVGLKDRVLANLATIAKIQLKTGLYNHRGKKRDPDEVALRWMVSPENMELSGAQKFGQQDKTQGFFGGLWRGLSSIGTAVGQVSELPKFDAMRRSAPVVLSIAEMMLIISIPLVLVFSGYSTKVIVSLTVILFGLVFIPFWWELADWLDDNLTSMLYDVDGIYNMKDLLKFGPGVGLMVNVATRLSDGWIINLTLGTMYGVVPGLWLTILGWTGIQVGNLASMGMAISQGTSSAAQNAAEGGKAVGKAVGITTDVATGGTSTVAGKIMNKKK